MRLSNLSKWLFFGGGVAALVLGGRRLAARSRDLGPRRSRAVRTDDLQPDPRDPVQGFQESVELAADPLSVDALTVADVEAAQDLASLEVDIDDRARELDTPSTTDLDAINAAAHDTGELYGVHTPRATDTDPLPDEKSGGGADDGETWIETLQASATEYGAEAEREIDVMDEMDEPPHPTDTRDIPVADRGSAGPGGV